MFERSKRLQDLIFKLDDAISCQKQPAILSKLALKVSELYREFGRIDFADAYHKEYLKFKNLTGDEKSESRLEILSGPTTRPHLNVAYHRLTDELDVDPETALQEISGLDKEQASALVELYLDGLRGEHLRKNWEPVRGFCLPMEFYHLNRGAMTDILCRSQFFPAHKKVLIHLIRERHTAPDKAVREISGLEVEQVLKMLDGETRQDILRPGK